MTVRELAQALSEFPNQGAVVVIKVGDDWSDVRGVEPTGEHRNAVTLGLTIDAGTGSPGVIVHPSDRGQQ